MPCRGVIGAVFGHKFMPRYSETAVLSDNALKFGTIPLTTDAFESMKDYTQTYERDVCERCGATIRHDRPLPYASVPTDRQDS